MEITFINLENLSGKYSKELYIQKNFPDEYLYIKKYIAKLDLVYKSFKEAVYVTHYNLTSIPLCKTCQNNKVKFKNYKNGFTTYCCRKCQALDKDLQKIREQTNLKKYGVKYAWNSEQTTKTIKEKYSVDNISQCQSIKDKKKSTTLKTLGVEFPSQSKEVQQKIKKNYQQKYNVDYYTQTEEFKIKSSETSLKKYNTTHSSQSLTAINKRQLTLLNKYGVDNYSKSETYKKAIRDKWIIFWKTKITLDCLDLKFISFEYGQNKLTLQCNKEHTFVISSNLYNLRKIKKHQICIQCNPISKNTSFFEEQISDFIQSQGFNTIRNNKKIIKGELDIYIPELKIAIEHNGIYYHSEKFRDNNYHFNKYLKCQEQGIKLIQIWEDDWYLKLDIIKSRLLNILHKSTIKVFARKCIIKNINSIQYRDFIEKNHMQGYKNCKYKIGLFYNDELISIMSFSKNKNLIKLERFCNKLNTNVVGAASKLFKYSLKTYNFKLIVSYADLDWGIGSLYRKLGFQFDGYTTRNYWYLIDGIKQNRFKFRKSALIKDGFDSTKTEKEIMNERGILKIYGSGNAKWIYLKD